MGKNMKVHTQLLMGFSIIGVLVIALLYSGYSTAATIISLPEERQPSYLSSYATFTSIRVLQASLALKGGAEERGGGILFSCL